MKIFKPLIALLFSLIVLSGCDTEKAINEIDDLISTISDFSKSDTPEIKNSKEDIALIGAETNSENYAFINDNKTELSQEDQNLLNEKGNDRFWADYPDLDKYGRAGKVTALITNKAVQSHSSKAQERPSFD
ncbi:hypothetical protein HMPREF3211_01023, partial [Staphylococcus aureus]